MHIREAIRAEAKAVTDLLRRMVEEMERSGHHRVRRERHVWDAMEGRVQNALDDPSRLLLLAEPDPEAGPVALVDSRVESPHLVFEQVSVMHVSAVYVEPPYRRRGVARSLLTKALDWAKERGCRRAELNVQISNTALHLYREFGFREMELRMRKEI